MRQGIFYEPTGLIVESKKPIYVGIKPRDHPMSSSFAIYGPTITVTQLSNLSTWAFPVFYKNILDGGITPDVWLIKVHTYITFESTESMLSFEMTLAQQRLGDHPIHLDIHFGQYFHLKILLGAIK